MGTFNSRGQLGLLYFQTLSVRNRITNVGNTEDPKIYTKVSTFYKKNQSNNNKKCFMIHKTKFKWLILRFQDKMFRTVQTKF